MIPDHPNLEQCFIQALSESKRGFRHKPQHSGIFDDRLRMQSSASFQEIVTPGNKYNVPGAPLPTTKPERQTRSRRKKEKRIRTCRITMRCGQNDDCIPSRPCGHRAQRRGSQGSDRFYPSNAKIQYWTVMRCEKQTEGMIDDCL